MTARRHVRAAVAAVAAITGGGLAVLGASAVPALGGAPAAGAATINFGNPTWTVGPLNDAGKPIALSSPNVADTARRARRRRRRRVGQRLRLQPGHRRPGVDLQHRCPGQLDPVGGADTAGSSLDTVFVGTGDAGSPTPAATRPSARAAATSGSCRRRTRPPTATPAQRRAGVDGRRQPPGRHRRRRRLARREPGRPDSRQRWRPERVPVVPGATATSPRRPWPTSTATDRPRSSRAATRPPALVHNDRTANGGHLRVLSPDRQRRPAATQRRPRSASTQRTRPSQSSPAVGEFFGGSSPSASSSAPAPPINQSDTNKLHRPQHQLRTPWSATLNGNTKSSPALADVLGNGQLQVVEGTDNGTDRIGVRPQRRQRRRRLEHVRSAGSSAPS